MWNVPGESTSTRFEKLHSDLVNHIVNKSLLTLYLLCLAPIRWTST